MRARRSAVWSPEPPAPHATMLSPRLLLLVCACACLQPAAARPVRRTLNFNMFVLKPKQGTPDRVLVSTDGVSRFGPILEYLVQRVQGMMSVRLPPEPSMGDKSPIIPAVLGTVPAADAAENEVDGVQEGRTPGVVVRPSLTKPGTYEVEINVVVDDGQPEDKKTT